MIIETCKRHARWLWSHRTKTLGAVGVAAGALENQLQVHANIQLPGRGVLLIIFGSAVTIVGTYNSLAAYFGWTDPPSA